MSELEVLRKELERLRERVEELERRDRDRDIELRDGHLLEIRGAEKRLKMGKYSEKERVSERIYKVREV